MASRAEAQLVVEKIAEEHGHLSEDVLGQMTDAVRRLVENALLRKDRLIASSVVTYVPMIKAPVFSELC